MGVPIRREAEVAKDDIAERHGLSETPGDGELSTADSAGIERETPTNVIVEPLGEGRCDNDSRAATVADRLPSTQTADPAPSPVIGAAAGAARTDGAGVAAGAARAMEQETGPLFSGNEANELRARWDAVQVGFVDAPRDAVEHADNLVAETMKRLAEVFADERTKLEAQWNKGEDVSNEGLRLALRRYRSFFSRLLSI
jgi:hypothetical protein